MLARASSKLLPCILLLLLQFEDQNDGLFRLLRIPPTPYCFYLSSKFFCMVFFTVNAGFRPVLFFLGGGVFLCWNRDSCNGSCEKYSLQGCNAAYFRGSWMFRSNMSHSSSGSKGNAFAGFLLDLFFDLIYGRIMLLRNVGLSLNCRRYNSDERPLYPCYCPHLIAELF
jgi:hypothetical protein